MELYADMLLDSLSSQQKPRCRVGCYAGQEDQGGNPALSGILFLPNGGIPVQISGM